MTKTIEACVNEATTAVREKAGQDSLLHIGHEPETLWHKIDHLLYLPILGLIRPRDLYYYQGGGLQALYGFTVKRGIKCPQNREIKSPFFNGESVRWPPGSK